MSPASRRPTPTDREVAPDEPRTARKRRAIVDAATATFLLKGYLGTSMDEIAARAGVSKQTVYKQFADKDSLFSEIVVSTVDRASDPVHDEVMHLQDSGDLEADLRDLARRQLAMVMRPELLQLRRLVIAESARFPELGRLFYERGPGRTIAALAESFADLATKGLLTIEDPLEAAAQFNWLVMSGPLNEAMFLTGPGSPTAAALDLAADRGVRTFLTAFSPPKPSRARSPRR